MKSNSLAVSLSILTVSLSSLFWATYSGFCACLLSVLSSILIHERNISTDGRRPIYLFSLPFLCIGSLGVGLSQSVPTLMVFRVLQASGASAGMSVGSGAIADIYRLEERGTAMGIFFAVSRPRASHFARSADRWSVKGFLTRAGTRSSCWGRRDILFHLATHAIRPPTLRSIGIRFGRVSSSGNQPYRYPRYRQGTCIWEVSQMGLAESSVRSCFITQSESHGRG